MRLWRAHVHWRGARVLGIAILVPALVVLPGLFVALLVVILLLIPIEKQQLAGAYGESHARYRARVRALIRFVY